MKTLIGGKHKQSRHLKFFGNLWSFVDIWIEE